MFCFLLFLVFLLLIYMGWRYDVVYNLVILSDVDVTMAALGSQCIYLRAVLALAIGVIFIVLTMCYLCFMLLIVECLVSSCD